MGRVQTRALAICFCQLLSFPLLQVDFCYVVDDDNGNADYDGGDDDDDDDDDDEDDDGDGDDHDDDEHLCDGSVPKADWLNNHHVKLHLHL